MKTLLCISFLLCATGANARPLSDSLPIEGHYSQAGSRVSRFKLERFLLDKGPSGDYVDRSLGCKWSGHGVGALLWSANIGMAVYEFNQVYKAIENQKVILDTTGMREPFSNNLFQFTIPLTIGTGVASFVQGQLYERSDYLLHRGALAFNASTAKDTSNKQDLRIEKVRLGVYRQGGLTFTEPVLRSVLREQAASVPHSVWSTVLKECGTQAGSWGGTYLGLAIVSLVQENLGEVPFAIDVPERQLNLTMGISLTAGSIATAIVSAVIRNKGIKRYNEARITQ